MSSSFNTQRGNQTAKHRGRQSEPDLNNENFTQMQQRMSMIRDVYEKEDDEISESDLNGQPTTEQALTSARANIENIETPYSHSVEGKTRANFRNLQKHNLVMN